LWWVGFLTNEVMPLRYASLFNRPQLSEISLEQVKATQAFGIEQAKALSSANFKIIANSANLENGIRNLMDIFSANGGTQLGAMLKAFAQTEKGEALLGKIGVKPPAEKR
jgi:flotillin